MKTKYNFYGKGKSLRWAITLSCWMAFILFGYDQGVFGGIVGNADFLETFGHPSSGLEGIIVSSYNLGAFTGCIVNFFFCEKLGRRKAMWVAMAFIIVSVACLTNHLTAGRRSAADDGLHCPTYDRCSMVHWYWDRY
jgi:MFS family permease